jgi:hypothetical protein
MLATRLAVLTCVGALLLSGCGDDDGTDAPEPPTLGETTAAASEEPSPSATPTDDGPIPADPVDGEVIRGLSAATSDEQRAVEDVWFRYWTEVIGMYRDLEVDRDALYAVANEAAASGPVDYVEQMKSRGETQVGGVIAATSRIKVSGDEATVSSCFRNSTYNVASNGRPAETGSTFFTTDDRLVREGPDWRVVETTTTSRNQECDYR